MNVSNIMTMVRFLRNASEVQYLRCAGNWSSHHATSNSISSAPLGALSDGNLFFWFFPDEAVIVVEGNIHRLALLVF